MFLTLKVASNDMISLMVKDDRIKITSGGKTTVIEEMNKVKPNEVDQILSRELSSLNIEYREPIDEEVHGVRCLAPPETPEMLNESLLKLSKEIDSIGVKPAYNRSQELALLPCYSSTNGGLGTYVNTANFRMKFLRCELFDAKKGAARLVLFLDLLLLAFEGKEEILVRPPRITDLDETELAILKAGNFQLLPYRDRSGRRIFTVVQNMGMHHEFMKTLPMLLYIMFVATESIESQRKGLVIIFFASTVASGGATVDKVLPAPSHCELAMKFNECLPIRTVAIHLCFPNTVFYRVFRSFLLLSHFSSTTRFRFKTHSGKWTELQYQLMGYGIPIDILPLSQAGNIKTTILQHWIWLRELMEKDPRQDTSSSDESDDSSVISSDLLNAIECPNENDVIFRMRRSYMCHPGNVMFRSLIESKLDEHAAATRKRKAEIAWFIVEEVERKGGRFLKWDERGWWTEFESRSEIRYKIPTYFRDFTRNIKSRRNRAILNATNLKQKQKQQVGCQLGCITSVQDE